MTLRERQKRILTFIHQHMTHHGFSPTIREIGLAVQIFSTSVVNHNVKRLVQGGYLVKTSAKSRTIRLTSLGISILHSSSNPPLLETYPLPEQDVIQLQAEITRLRSENERLGQELRAYQQRSQREHHPLRQPVSV